MSSFVLHSSLLTVTVSKDEWNTKEDTGKSVELVVAHDGFLCIMEIIHIFLSSYFDCRGVFQIVLISHYCVMR